MMQGCLSILLIPAALLGLLGGSMFAIQGPEMYPPDGVPQVQVATSGFSSMYFSELTDVGGAPFYIDVPYEWTWNYDVDTGSIALSADPTLVADLSELDITEDTDFSGTLVGIVMVPSADIEPIEDLDAIATDVFDVYSGDGLEVSPSRPLLLPSNPAIIHDIQAVAGDGFVVVVASPTHYMLVLAVSSELDRTEPILRAMLASIVLEPYESAGVDMRDEATTDSSSDESSAESSDGE